MFLLVAKYTIYLALRVEPYAAADDDPNAPESGIDAPRVFIWDLHPDTREDCELKIANVKKAVLHVSRGRMRVFAISCAVSLAVVVAAYRTAGGGTVLPLQSEAGRKLAKEMTPHALLVERVGLDQVDDVELVAHAAPRVAYSKVKPLRVAACVDVGPQNQVVLVARHLDGAAY